MKTIEIQEVENGYIINMSGTIKNNGRYVRNSLEQIDLLEFIGEMICDYKVKVEKR